MYKAAVTPHPRPPNFDILRRVNATLPEGLAVGAYCPYVTIAKDDEQGRSYPSKFEIYGCVASINLYPLSFATFITLTTSSTATVLSQWRDMVGSV